jgi:predicted nucleotide-binding protein
MPRVPVGENSQVASEERMLLALERVRAKEILTELHRSGSELRTRAGMVFDVAGVTLWNDDLRDWEHATANALQAMFTNGRAAAEFESQRVKRVSLQVESAAERYDRRQQDLRRELEYLSSLHDRLYAIEEGSRSATVFVVHGPDEVPRSIVAQVLGEARLGEHDIVLLNEHAPAQVDEGDYGVVVASAGAGQSLVFAMGYLVGRLGPGRVMVLQQRGVQPPPQHPGVSYAELDPSGNWRAVLLEGLKGAGLSFRPA